MFTAHNRMGENVISDTLTMAWLLVQKWLVCQITTLLFDKQKCISEFTLNPVADGVQQQEATLDYTVG